MSKLKIEHNDLLLWHVVLVYKTPFNKGLLKVEYIAGARSSGDAVEKAGKHFRRKPMSIQASVIKTICTQKKYPHREFISLLNEVPSIFSQL